MMAAEVEYRVLHYCLVCEGCGGWDKRTFKSRFRTKLDTADTYLWCLYCSSFNIIRRKS